MLSKIFDWFTLRDFDEARRHNRIAIIRRFARGNVSFQNGNICDQASFDRLRKEGDRAIAELAAMEKNARAPWLSSMISRITLTKST